MKKNALAIIQKLQKSGFKAYLVGGCVRDILLHQDPKDYDIATNALPEQVEALFERTYPIGKSFGVILVNQNDDLFEVATFRSESDYTDGRRPETVTFSTAEQDAQRRDFTINGIFLDPVTEQFHDFVDGISDLKRGLLRFIGDPDTRIQEDHLRIIRAIRFANRFSLDYHNDTKEALKRHASLIVHVTPERLGEELTKIILDPHAEGAFRDIDTLDIGPKILPELWNTKTTPQPADHHSEGSVFEHSLKALGTLPPGLPKEVYWSTLLHDIGKAQTVHYQGSTLRYPDHHLVGETLSKTVCKRLRFARKTTKSIGWIIHHHHIFDTWSDMRRARQLFYFDHQDFQNLLHMHRADVLGSHPQSFEDRPHLKAQIEAIQTDYYDTKAAERLPSQIPSILTGDDICTLLNLTPGPHIGTIKKALKEQVIEGAITTRSQAEAFVKSYDLSQTEDF